jgi:hypothetical protein
LRPGGERFAGFIKWLNSPQTLGLALLPAGCGDMETAMTVAPKRSLV